MSVAVVVAVTKSWNLAKTTARNSSVEPINGRHTQTAQRYEAPKNTARKFPHVLCTNGENCWFALDSHIKAEWGRSRKYCKGVATLPSQPKWFTEGKVIFYRQCDCGYTVASNQSAMLL